MLNNKTFRSPNTSHAPDLMGTACVGPVPRAILFGVFFLLPELAGF